jgi:CHAD domain-containing protein
MIARRAKSPRKACPPPVRADATPAAALRAAMRECLEHVAANVAGAAAGADPEYLHQLRVGMRRLRAALRASRSLWRRKDIAALRDAMQPLREASGVVRDIDVVMPLLPAAALPRARVQRRAAQARLARLLRRPLAWPLPRPRRRAQPALADFARNALSRLDRRALRRGARTDWSDVEARHVLRSRLRRLRYAAEFLREAFPGSDAAPLAGSLKALQRLLGELNDLEVARRLSAQLAQPLQPASARERALRARLPAAWRRFAAAPRFWRRPGD